MTEIAAIYARTSGFESQSCREQISICKRRCEERTWRPRYILRDENMSGGDRSRPGYQALWEHVQASRIDVLVTWKIDRIARSLSEMSTLEEEFRACGVSLHSCTEPIDTTNAQGRFVFGILATAGQLERDLGSERIRAVLSERARRGMWMHKSTPFGYCLGKARALRPHPSERYIVPQVFDTHAREGSYAETAARLNEAGILRRGRRWTAGTVQRVIENEIHVGRYEHWGQQLVRPGLRLVGDDAWQRAIAVRKANPRAGQTASESLREAAIRNVFDQYVAGLDYLDSEPSLSPNS